MPFGKHKGKKIDDVPVNYIKWMLANIPDLTPSLYSALVKRVEPKDLVDERME